MAKRVDLPDWVSVRPYQPGDGPPVYAAIQESAAQTSVWLPELSAELTQGDVNEWIASTAALRERGEAYHLAIVDRRDDRFLGGCGLTGMNRRHLFCNLYYWVRTSRVGQGVGPAAARLAARWAFEQLGLQRVEIVADSDNVPSQRVAEKAGATREGVLRHRLRTAGLARPAVMFSLIPEDLGLAPAPPG
jgi:RimJ/RimL family protein N-acetyltransferase